MIIWGTRTKGERVEDYKPFNSYCPVCKKNTQFIVITPIKRFTLYFIPTFKIGGGEELFQECQSCETAFVYNKEISTPVTEEPSLSINSFPLKSLLTSVAYVINADGIVKKDEVATSFALIVQLFGLETEKEKKGMLKLLHNEIANSHSLENCLNFIKSSPEAKEVKKIIIEFLFAIACADDELHIEEVKVIQKIAHALSVLESDWNRLYISARNSLLIDTNTNEVSKAMNVLELKEEFSENELKNSYKRLISLYHPDKVEYLGPEIKILAAKKTLEINQAYTVLLKQFH